MSDMAQKQKLAGDIRKCAKSYIDTNVWDGEDRIGAEMDFVKFTPDELQELIFDLLDYLEETSVL